MSTSTPFVSVVVPAHNSEKHIAQAIQSIFDQRWKNLEVIVVDDGSVDGTRQVVESFVDQVRYIHQSNRGPSVARNAGIRIAQGEYVCFLDADDLWFPGKLESQITYMRAHPEIGLVFHDEEESDGGEQHFTSILSNRRFYSEFTSHQPVQNAFRMLLMENFIPTSTVMVRRECLAQSGLFDESLWISEDRDLWLRVAVNCGIACLPQVLGRKRAHSANLSANSELTLLSRIYVWNKAHRVYPDLASAHLIQSLLANAQLQLAFLYIERGRLKEATGAASQSLGHAARSLFSPRRQSPYARRYSWFRGTVLFPLKILLASVPPLARIKERIAILRAGIRSKT